MFTLSSSQQISHNKAKLKAKIMLGHLLDIALVSIPNEQISLGPVNETVL